MPDSHLDTKSIVSGSGTKGGGRSSVSIRSGQGLDSDSGSLAGGGSGSSGVGKDKEKEKEKGTSQSQTSLEAMYQVRLLAALRSGEPSAIHPFLQELTTRRGSSPDTSNEADPCALALHLAIRVASPATISLLLSYRAMDVNGVYPPGSGTTALHLAAGLGRVDVVGLLLDMEGVDDSRLDATGRGVRDVAKGSGVLKVIDDSRALLNASFRSLLHAYTLSPLSTPAPPALLALLASPRAKLIDLDYVDEETGRGILHEAVRRNEMSVVEGCVRAGVDVFGRDKKGKGVLEGKVAHGGEGVRGYLRQYANASASLGAGGVGGGGGTSLNVGLGTSPRSRSSVQLGVGGYEEAPSMKGYLAKYTNVARGYNPRWFVLSNGVLSYYRTREEEGIASRGSLAMGGATVRFGGEKGSVTLTSSSTSTSTSTSSSMKRATRFEIWGGGQKWFVKAAHPAESARWVEGLVKSVEWAKKKESGLLAPGAGSVHSNVGVGVGEKAMVDEDDYNEEEDDEDEEDEEEEATPPHPDWPLTFNALKAQLDLVLPSSSPLLDELMKMMEEREGWFRKKLKREQRKNRVWEESLRSVVEEGEGLERELRRGYLGRRKRGRVPGRWEENEREEGEREGGEADRDVIEEKERGEKERKDPPPPLVLSPKSPKRPLVTRQDEDDEEDEEDDDDDGDEFFDAIESGNLPGLVVHESLKSPLVSPSLGGATPTRGDSFTHAHTPTGNGSPRVALSRRSTLSPAYPQGQGGGDETGGGSGREEVGEGEEGEGGILVPHEVYAPYEILRTRLPLEADDRPSTSLWSVLKGSIGKDLTRISFPVFFNEPTSMLQRMAEDMEFSGCLDVACEEGDAHRRIAFVAAFAMSNYSSTIGRIAKPFNPLLSETFEYCRLDPGHAYRYFSEQVSHHPPISACYAESEKRKGGRAWRYFGEVDAQNKFMGKSFEIRPTGVAHVELDLGSKGNSQEGGKEHYTWKKVTTNVSGFILGSPTIDHYGDMVVTNHATGDRCVLTFKPRGWRGKDAYEISGSVVDGESGEVVYEIAGRWDDRLVARSSSFHSSSHSPSHPSSSTSQEYILLWQNSPKPPPGASPFNLTPFAITLNALPSSLVPLLPRTDSRKRPDQRAFEVGLWEKANELKGVLEERQRGVRREREMRLVGAGAGAGGHAHEHTPRWFVKSVDGDSGERVWEPKRVTSNGSGREVEYWYERARGEWEGVDEIFVEMPSEVEDRLRSVGEGM